jgi:7-carboxy-7-deazaguanine synthase
MIEDKKYPISEIFTSWQGEGAWSGTRMTFIRFAGCNVGKPIPTTLANSDYYGNLPIWQEECTTWDGRKFLCDTDFRVKERLTAKEILAQVPKNVEHIVFTGGEPLLHIDAINYIIDLWEERMGQHIRNDVHIETSGTKNYWRKGVWLTVSPKANFLPQMIQRANEIKFLVDIDFDEKKAEEIAALDTDGDTIIWLSSINSVDFLNKPNMDKCKEIAERHPTWRITQQSHKIWGVR